MLVHGKNHAALLAMQAFSQLGIIAVCGLKDQARLGIFAQAETIADSKGMTLQYWPSRIAACSQHQHVICLQLTIRSLKASILFLSLLLCPGQVLRCWGMTLPSTLGRNPPLPKTSQLCACNTCASAAFEHHSPTSDQHLPQPYQQVTTQSHQSL